MIAFKTRGSRSRLDPTFGRILAAETAERLVARCKGHQCRFITLTYRREGYSDPRELYRRAKEERHVREFIRRLQRHLGESLRGRWMRKMEFQEGGWVHFHVILLDVSQLLNRGNALTQLWGHGWAYDERAKQKTLRYVCKYISKDEDYPAWLLLEPMRSVKIMAASPGFWGESDVGEDCQEDEEDDECNPCAGNVYTSIGEMLERGSEQTIICGGGGLWKSVKVDAYEVWEAAKRLGGRALDGAAKQAAGIGSNWLAVAGVEWDRLMCELRVVSGVAAEPRRSGVDRYSGGAPTEEWSGNAGGAGLYLIQARNPHVRRKWLDEVMAYFCGWREEVEGFFQNFDVGQLTG